MINYIKKLFDYSHSKDIKTAPPASENQIIISCDQNGLVKVKITISHVGTNAAKDFGKMLFLMNEGFYVQSILDIIKEIKESGSDTNEFIEQMISSWSECVVSIESMEKDEDNQPIISPTLFDKGSKS